MNKVWIQYECSMNIVWIYHEYSTNKLWIQYNKSFIVFLRVFKDGDRIIKQGDAADGMYFVEQGQIIISVLDDSGKEVEINRIIKGGYFGELALVTHRPRAASAFCDGDVRCACKSVVFCSIFFCLFANRMVFIFSFGRGSLREVIRSVHGDHEAKHHRLWRTNAQDIRLKAQHPGYPMKEEDDGIHLLTIVFIILHLLLLVVKTNKKQKQNSKTYISDQITQQTYSHTRTHTKKLSDFSFRLLIGGWNSLVIVHNRYNWEKNYV